jgi:hypothetical protein
MHMLVGKIRTKLQLEKHSCILKDNIQINREKIGYKDVNWIHLAQESVQCPALVYMVLSFRVS